MTPPATPTRGFPAALGEAWRKLAQAFGGRAAGPAPDGEPGEVARSLRADAPDREAYWNTHFNTADPWGYGSDYEQVKYDRTARLLEGLRVERALELACAEGHFTPRLAAFADRLEATDISGQALARAAQTVAHLPHVSTRTLDFMAEDIGAGWDLIVCSEVLYYSGARERLAHVCRKMAAALKPGGYLLSAHAYVLADDRTRTGFEWGDYGAATIANTFEGLPDLERVKAIDTEFYRIDLYRKRPGGKQALRPAQIVRLPTGPLPNEAARQALVRWGALTSRNQARATESTGDIPILMYHRIADDGPDSLAQWRVSPAAFESQIRFLARRGYAPVSIEQWNRACDSGEWIAGRPIMLTFDDGYADFLQTAWPILEHYEFSAHVFLVTGHVGGHARWDEACGPPAPLMGWPEIVRLDKAGCGFGSHLQSHTRADQLADDPLAQEAAQSRAAIEAQLGHPIDSVCLPHDYTDDRVTGIMQAAGYRSVFGVRAGIASIHQPRLDVPRLAVLGDTTLDQFAASLGVTAQPPEPRDLDRQVGR